MTRDYAPTRPIRRTRLTARGWATLYAVAIVLGLVLGLTAELWDPWAVTR